VLNNVYWRWTWATAKIAEMRGAKLNFNRDNSNNLVPMTRGQDEGLDADYLAYIPSLCRVTMGVVKDNKKQ